MSEERFDHPWLHTRPLYLQLLGFFRQYSRAKDWRHLKTLGWMVSVLIGSGKGCPRT